MSGLLTSLATGGPTAAVTSLAQQAGTALGIDSLAAALGLGLDWKASYRQASFRGAPFWVRTSAVEGGRRGPSHQFPLRDRPFGEDLGAKGRIYRLTGYVLGSDYLSQADDLYQACHVAGGSGTLLHPYITAPVTAICRVFRRMEDEKRGGIAVIELIFEDAGTTPSPTATVDTASSVLGMIGPVLAAAKQVYGLAVVLATQPGFLLAFAEQQLGAVAGAFLGLPAGAIADLVDSVEAITASPSDTVATPAAICAAFDAYADSVVSAPAGTYQAGNDPSFGLAAIATGFGTASAGSTAFPIVPLTTPTRVQQAANQAALVATVQAAAVAAMAEIYAQTDFATQQAATAAQTQIATIIDTQATTAADAGYTALYVALATLYAGTVADMQQRALQLPMLSAYTLPDSIPAIALAQRLYRDPTRAAELVTLNSTPHPAFMPAAGVALVS
jgi:hypothetical protein